MIGRAERSAFTPPGWVCCVLGSVRVIACSVSVSICREFRVRVCIKLGEANVTGDRGIERLFVTIMNLTSGVQFAADELLHHVAKFFPETAAPLVAIFPDGALN